MPVAAGQGEQEASGGGYAPAPSGKAPAAGPDRRDEPPRVSPGHGPFAEHRPAGAKQPSRTRLGAIRSAGCGAEAQAHAQSRPIGPHFRRERGCVDSGAGGGERADGGTSGTYTFKDATKPSEKGPRESRFFARL